MEGVEADFKARRYDAVIAHLQGRTLTEVPDLRMLGLALLRLKRVAEAEPLLTRAYAAGDPEATVEYGNLLRLQGRFEDAIALFEEHVPALTGELRLRAIRWWGVSLFQIGKLEIGIRKVEAAWVGYSALDDTQLSAIVGQNLAHMLQHVGQFRRSERILQDAIALVNPNDLENVLRFKRTLAGLYIEMGRWADARGVMDSLAPMVAHISMSGQIYHWSVYAEIHKHAGERDAYLSLVHQVSAYAHNNSHDYALHEWVAFEQFDIHLRAGAFNHALRVYYTFERDFPGLVRPRLQLAKAALHRQRGELVVALHEFDTLTSAPFDSHGQIEYLFQRACAEHAAGRLEAAGVTLRVGLETLNRLGLYDTFATLLNGMPDLLAFASIEPGLAPYLEPVLEHLPGHAPAPQVNGPKMQATTLGAAEVRLNGEPVAFTLRGTLALLVCLARRPNQTRAELQAELCPDKSATAGSAYLRQSLRDLRDTLGEEVVVHAGPHNQPRYRLGPGVQLDLDLERFYAAVDSGDLPRALALYRGPLLPEVHDIPWVLAQRTAAQGALSAALREALLVQREAGEWRRVILLAGQLLRLDPAQPDVLGWRAEAEARLVDPAQLEGGAVDRPAV